MQLNHDAVRVEKLHGPTGVMFDERRVLDSKLVEPRAPVLEDGGPDDSEGSDSKAAERGGLHGVEV